jgi:hypothetical protein
MSKSYPATILSRVQRFNLDPVSTDAQLSGHSADTSQSSENIAIDDAALRNHRSHGNGSFRDSNQPTRPGAKHSRRGAASLHRRMLKSLARTRRRSDQVVDLAVRPLCGPVQSLSHRPPMSMKLEQEWHSSYSTLMRSAPHSKENIASYDRS